MADRDVYRTILPSGAISAAGDSGPIPVSSDVDPTGLDVVINLTSFTGGTTPSITFAVAWMNDATDVSPPTGWGTATSTAALTGAGRTVLTLPRTVRTIGNTTPRYFRVSWTIAGAPTAVNHSGIFCE